MDAVAGVRTLSAREEELLGLLAGFPDDGEGGSSRELSFSDLVDAGFRPTSAHRDATSAPAAARDDQGSAVSPGKQEAAAASKQQQREQAAAREKRQRRQRSGGGGGSNRGSCGGGGDGVLLNFYVPGLLTRSMTAPRPGRGALPHGARHDAPAKAAAVAAGKARTRAPLGIGCWPALWGRSRDHRSTAKVSS